MKTVKARTKAERFSAAFPFRRKFLAFNYEILPTSLKLCENFFRVHTGHLSCFPFPTEKLDHKTSHENFSVMKPGVRKNLLPAIRSNCINLNIDIKVSGWEAKAIFLIAFVVSLHSTAKHIESSKLHFTIPPARFESQILLFPRCVFVRLLLDLFKLHSRSNS